MASPETSTPLRIAIADDHPMVREGTESLLNNSEGMVPLWSASDGATCLRMIRENRPDVLLLDLHLPDLHGLEVARRIRAEAPEVKVVIITGYDYQAYRRELQQMGISIVIDKAATGREIIAAIQAATESDASTLDRGVVHLPQKPLTPREREVLTLMAKGQRNPDIAETLCVSLKTVEFHVSNILNELGARSRLEAVVKAQTFGLVPPPLATDDTGAAPRSPRT
jgi:DNA-binding NarL/FixJ family response regulator